LCTVSHVSICTVLVALLGLAERFEGRPLRVAIVSLYALYFGLLPCLLQLQKECSSGGNASASFPRPKGLAQGQHSPDAKILVENLEVGYFAKRHTSDWPGLVSPEVFKLVKADPHIDFFQIANRLHLDYVGVHEGATDGYNTHVPANFKLVATFRTSETGSVMNLGESLRSVLPAYV